MGPHGCGMPGQGGVVTLRGHIGAVLSARFSPDGSRIITGSFDKTARVWDAVTGNNLVTLIGHEEVVWSVGFSPDASRIVTASGPVNFLHNTADTTARVWDAAVGKEILAFDQ